MYIPAELQQLTYDIYARRSSDDKDHQVASLPSQKKELIDSAQFNHLKVARIAEESMSAKNPGRPVFNEEIRRLEEGKIQGLIIWDLSRASRNPVDSGTLSWLLQKEILKAIVTPQRVYLPQDNVLIIGVEFGMANQYLRDLSINVKRGLKTKINKGQRPGLAPEGYLNDGSAGKGNSKNVVDSERFPLIRKMWDMLLTGAYTVPQIQKIANKEWGYQTRKHKVIGGTPLARSTLYRMFTNTFYFGWYWYGGEWHKGEHTPMITEEEYDKAQSILGKKGKQRPKTREFSYTGMIRCAKCGSAITAEEKINRYGTRYTYYHCTHKKDRHCKQPSIELKELEKQINNILTSLEIPESFKTWAIEFLNELHDKEAEEQKVITGSVSGAYQDCLTRINNLLKLKISPMNTDGSILSDSDFKNQMLELQKEKSQLDQQQQNLSKRVDQWVELSQKTFQFACYARYWFEKGGIQDRKIILQTIGSNFLLKDKILDIEIPKPFKSIIQAKVEAEKILEKFEPVEKVDLSVQLATLYSSNSILRRRWDSNPRVYY